MGPRERTSERVHERSRKTWRLAGASEKRTEDSCCNVKRHKREREKERERDPKIERRRRYVTRWQMESAGASVVGIALAPCVRKRPRYMIGRAREREATREYGRDRAQKERETRVLTKEGESAMGIVIERLYERWHRLKEDYIDSIPCSRKKKRMTEKEVHSMSVRHAGEGESKTVAEWKKYKKMREMDERKRRTTRMFCKAAYTVTQRAKQCYVVTRMHRTMYRFLL